MFTKSDRDNLAAVKILLVQHVHEKMGASGKEELFAKLDALAESQGKLLARMDAIDSGLHETAMRNHQQIMFHMRPKRKKGKRS